jgi:hypothetical protein
VSVCGTRVGGCGLWLSAAAGCLTNWSRRQVHAMPCWYAAAGLWVAMCVAGVGDGKNGECKAPAQHAGVVMVLA